MRFKYFCTTENSIMFSSFFIGISISTDIAVFFPTVFRYHGVPHPVFFSRYRPTISNAVAIHVHDIKEGKLAELREEDHAEIATYEHMLATNLDDDLVVTKFPLTGNTSEVNDILYPSPDFTVAPWQ